LLLFLYLVARFTLLLTAWTATARGNELPGAPAAEPAVPEPPVSEPPVSEPPDPEPAIPGPERVGPVRVGSAAAVPVPVRPLVPAPPPAGPAASRGALGAALGVGMLLGAWLRRPRRPRDPAP
jgi:hypothetical protein